MAEQKLSINTIALLTSLMLPCGRSSLCSNHLWSCESWEGTGITSTPRHSQRATDEGMLVWAPGSGAGEGGGHNTPRCHTLTWAHGYTGRATKKVKLLVHSLLSPYNIRLHQTICVCNQPTNCVLMSWHSIVRVLKNILEDKSLHLWPKPHFARRVQLSQ